MITIRNVFVNIAKGQSASSSGKIIQSFHNYYKQAKSKIKIIDSGKLSNGTVIYLKVPSERKADTFYDIVLWFGKTKKTKLDIPIKVYSNSPAFAYNFAFLFYQKNSLLFPELYPIIFLKIPPKVRNPFGLFGFDKHIYAALKYCWRLKLSKITKDFKNLSELPIKSFEEKQKELK